jgi:hypothetical protein
MPRYKRIIFPNKNNCEIGFNLNQWLIGGSFETCHYTTRTIKYLTINFLCFWFQLPIEKKVENRA